MWNHGNLFTNEEDNYLKENYLQMSYKEIGEVLGRKDTSIKDRLQKLGLRKRKQSVWTEEEKQKLRNFHGKEPNLYQYFPNRTRQSVNYQAFYLGLENKRNIGRFNINIDFFKVWSEEMAYILGLIAADGNVIDEPKRLTITLENKDRYMLEKIAGIMGSNRPIAKRKTGCNDFVITSGEIVTDLNQLGIFPKKSLSLEWIDVPEEYMNHFIRGYIDGDGCICLYPSYRQLQSGELRVDNKFEISMLGTENFLKGIAFNISKHLNLPYQSNYQTSSKAKRLKYGGKKALEIAKWLYKDATIFLDRKHETYINYLQKTDNGSNVQLALNL